MNGDLKIFDAKHSELVKVAQLHQDTAITDLLYFQSELLKRDVVVTASESPNAELIFGSVADDGQHVDVLGKAKQSVIDECGGVSCLV